MMTGLLKEFMGSPRMIYACGAGHRWWVVMVKGTRLPVHVDCLFCTYGAVGEEAGEAVSSTISSVNPLAVGGETACEHLKNAQQIGLTLIELLDSKGLTALAGDVRAISGRIDRAREEIGKGNIGR